LRCPDDLLPLRPKPGQRPWWRDARPHCGPSSAGNNSGIIVGRLRHDARTAKEHTTTNENAASPVPRGSKPRGWAGRRFESILWAVAGIRVSDLKPLRCLVDKRQTFA